MVEIKSPKRTGLGKNRISIAVVTSDPWRKLGLESFLTANGYAVGDLPTKLVLVDAPGIPDEIHEMLVHLHTQFASARLVVFLPNLQLSLLEPCLTAGAVGVLGFDNGSDALLNASRTVQHGNIWAPRNLMARVIEILGESSKLSGSPKQFGFTSSERTVLKALRDELTNKEIARLLGRSEATVKFHIARLLRKTHTTNRHQLRELVMRSTA